MFPSFSFFRRPSNAPEFLEDREQFLPFRAEILLERMLQDPLLNDKECRQLSDLHQTLVTNFHAEYHTLLESLKRDFVPFDPDCETLSEPEYSVEELQTIQLRLYANIRRVLQIGNYRELTREQLKECLALQPVGGLSISVDTDNFDEFHVYYRGIRKQEETENFLFFLKRTRWVTLLKRVFVMARFKQKFDERLLIKMFKDIPIENIKIIAPKVKLGMPIFDRVKIGGSVLGSLFTPISKLVFAFTFSWIYFWVILTGLVIAAVKGILSFLNSKTKYMHRFSSNLYFSNLSNNGAALTTLLDAAEEQEVKETLLSYYILYVSPNRELTLQELDQNTENWLEKQFHHCLDFEVNDAVRKLAEKNFLEISTLDTTIHVKLKEGK
ncbi:MAG: DUF3754 domain-containing protein [Planctomycetaceae bacterium]|jgi:hypothetical protein|nr:DUF3754 domain-containing protein [Planctomycetaceae bacterium]